MVGSKIKRLRELPTIPEVLRRLFEVILDESSTFHDISEVIRHDQSITERILRIANASYFGHSGRVKTIEQAVMFLGQDLVKGIALGAVAFHVGDEKSRDSLRALWRHSCEVAAISASLAIRNNEEGPVAFVAGLLHDIGRVALLTVAQEQYIEMLQRGCAIEDEMEVFELDHQYAGELFLRDAKLPEEIKNSVCKHHDAEQEGIIPKIVSLSESMSGLFFPKPECDGRWREERWAELAEYNLTEDNADEFISRCKKDVEIFDSLIH